MKQRQRGDDDRQQEERKEQTIENLRHSRPLLGVLGASRLIRTARIGPMTSFGDVKRATRVMMMVIMMI